MRSLRGTDALHAALLRRELGPAAQVLTEATGVAPIVLKGPVIAERLYGAPGLRAYADLDLLVPRRSLRDAVSALRDAGWEPARAGRTYAALGEPLPGFAEDYGHELHLVRRFGPGRGAPRSPLADQRRPALGSHSTMDGCSPEGATVPELGAHVVAPAPVDELLVLAVHLLSHGGQTRLIQHVDLALASEALPQSAVG